MISLSLVIGYPSLIVGKATIGVAFVALPGIGWVSEEVCSVA